MSKLRLTEQQIINLFNEVVITSDEIVLKMFDIHKIASSETPNMSDIRILARTVIFMSYIMTSHIMDKSVDELAMDENNE